MQIISLNLHHSPVVGAFTDASYRGEDRNAESEGS